MMMGRSGVEDRGLRVELRSQGYEEQPGANHEQTCNSGNPQVLTDGIRLRKPRELATTNTVLPIMIQTVSSRK